MKIFGSWTELVDLKFEQNGFDITLDSNTSTTYTADRTIILPLGDTAHTLVSLTSVDTLSNKTFGDSSDITKALTFDLSGATTAKTTTLDLNHTDDRTITLPDATDTLMGKATTDTMTNKTFDADGTGNSITNIENADIKALAAIDRSKIASGTINHVIINSGTGPLSSEAQLAITRGGTAGATATAGFDNLSPLTTKGDIIVRDSSNNIREPVGANGTVLTADSTQTSGIKWGTAGSGDVSSTATITDNRIVRGDGGAKGVQESGITIDDSDNVTGVLTLTADLVKLKKATTVDMSLASGETSMHPLLTVSTGDTLTIDSGADFFSIDTVTVDGTFTVSGNATVLH